MAAATLEKNTTLDAVQLANGLRPVLLHINRHLRREVHHLGITAGQLSLLAAIADRPGTGTGDLAAREGCSAPSISIAVERLVSAGFVTRAKPEDGDRRRVGFTATAEGQKVLRTVRSRRTAWLASRLRDLPDDQVRALETALPALAAIVDR